MEKQIILMTPLEASKKFFASKKSYAAMVSAARKNQLPSVRVGSRIFFEENSLCAFFAGQLTASVVTVQSQSKLRQDEVKTIAGIKRIE